MLLTWRGIECTPRKPWYWWALFAYIVILVTVGLLDSGLWIQAVLAVMMALALTIAYAQKPQPFTYLLEGDTLTVRNRLHLDLSTYRSLLIGDPWISGKQIVPGRTLILVPKRVLAFPVTVYLPDDDAEADSVQTILSTLVPLDADTSSYIRRLRILDRITRWFRLS